MSKWFRFVMAVGVLAMLTACERQNINLRERMAESLGPLGVRPLYPLRETPRLGSLYLFDTNAYSHQGNIPSHHDTYIHVSDDLAWTLERNRQANAASSLRFAKTTPAPPQPTGSAADLTTGEYVQGADPREAPPAAKPPAKAAPAPRPERVPLALAAFPGYTLASVEQFSVAGMVPQAFQSFLAAFGLRSTRYVHVEPIGVEIAELPLQELLDGVRDACASRGPTSILNKAVGDDVLARGIEQLFALHSERERFNNRSMWTSGRQNEPVNPQLVLMRRIYYLRGLRFTIDDSQTATAALQAAANLRLGQGVTPPTVAVVTPPPVAPAGVPGPAGGTAATATGALQAQIDALKGQLSALGASGGGTAQIASSYARASAVGVEFNHIFDRPMAFGFEPVAFNLDWHKDDKHNVLVGSRMIPGDGKRGIARICDWAPPIR